MSSCSMEIRLKSGERTVDCGATVAGTVLVRAFTPIRLRGISLRARWETVGRGAEMNDETPEIHLGEEAELAEGDERQWPFVVELPVSPASYEGELFSVRWALHAKADIAAGFDVAATLPITVSAPPGAGEETLGPAYDRDEVQRGQRVSQGGHMARNLVAGILVGGWCLFVGSMIGDWRDAMDADNVWAMLLLAAGALIVLGTIIVNVRARSRGFPVAVIDNPFVHRGGTMGVAVRFRPGRSIRVEEFVLRLVAQETVTRPGTRTNSLSQHELHSYEVRLDLPEQVEAGREYEFRKTIPIPDSATQTIAVPYNCVDWRLIVSLQPDRRPPVEVTYPFVVLP